MDVEITPKVWFGSLLLLLAGCSHPAPEKETTTVANLTYDKCAKSKFCKVSGLLSLEKIDGIMMGKLEVDAGRCITVSLPDNVIKELKNSEPIDKSMSGWVYGPNHDGISVLLKIKGRPVAHGRCGDFYLFVE